MANDEQYALLKKGVEAWNAWRDENRNIKPDLSDANLSGVSEEKIISALREANIIGMDLSERQAELMSVGQALVGADFSGARRDDSAARAGAPLPHTESENSAVRLRINPRTSKPQRPANAALRIRAPAEVEKLISAARSGRYAHRDATLILVAHRP